MMAEKMVAAIKRRMKMSLNSPRNMLSADLRFLATNSL